MISRGFDLRRPGQGAHFHSANYDAIHINGNKMGSGIDRAAFDAWKANYWEHRARDFGG